MNLHQTTPRESFPSIDEKPAVAGNLSLIHLPAKARELIEMIGLPATLRLIDEYGGQTFQVPKGKRVKGVAKLEELAAVIGTEAVKKLSHAFGGEVIAVPSCKRALLGRRDADLQARFDTMTSTGGLSARSAVNWLAKEFRVNATTVWKTLKRPTVASNP
ncbi:MAG: Mor transcription activator family protein [Sterolibacterium sp.]